MSPIEGILLTAVSGLCGAVVYLFKSFVKSNDEIKTALEECHKDREELWNHLAGLAGHSVRPSIKPSGN